MSSWSPWIFWRAFLCRWLDKVGPGPDASFSPSQARGFRSHRCHWASSGSRCLLEWGLRTRQRNTSANPLAHTPGQHTAGRVAVIHRLQLGFQVSWENPLNSSFTSPPHSSPKAVEFTNSLIQFPTHTSQEQISLHASPDKVSKCPPNWIPCTCQHGCQGWGHQPTYSNASSIEGTHRACFPEPEGTWRWPVWASLPAHHSSASSLLSNNPPVLPWWNPYITETGGVDQMSWQKQGCELGTVPPVPTVKGGYVRWAGPHWTLASRKEEKSCPVLESPDPSHSPSHGGDGALKQGKILVNRAASAMNIYINTLRNSAAFQLIQDLPRFIMNLKSYIRQSHSSISKSA